IQEWLAKHSDLLQSNTNQFKAADFSLLAHCTEKTNAVSSVKDWQTVFGHLGQTLSVIETGCCGMAGTYGHESENVETSKKIYSLSWAQVVNNPVNAGKLVATGYSCRSQTKQIGRATGRE